MRTLFARAARLACVAAALTALPFAPLRAQDDATRAALAKALDALRASGDVASIPDADRFTIGNRDITKGSSVAGPVAVANGDLVVHGIVDGDAVSWHGDVVVAEGGVVRGNAIALVGKVRLEGGTVGGDVRALDGDLARTAAGDAATPTAGRVARSLTFAGAWLAVLLIVGIGVLVVASSNLDAVTDALEQGVGRALAVGLAGQLAIVPVVTVLCTALALTILGILLIPFAIVVYAIVVAGLLTLGFLAVARIIGRSTGSPVGASDRERRAASLRALVVGVIVLMAPWFLAASLAWSPMAHLIMRTIAVAITWVAATAGLGAALVSRGGVRRRVAPAAAKAMNAASWQTPTPVAGVVAARRPGASYSTPVRK
ncbi:MAG: polymer-forming cytoskeletal protein [Gemmatimonadetes bacterium]|nr:polymer-forming cytoskeletal protein [Gemmatimonadota bacterium]MBI3566667.1 polymer-forming cytoskeletal protein [Gemmatimonadota bacterium]